MNSKDFLQWCLTFSSSSMQLAPPLMMGILNVTEDSFSDGGDYFQLADALTHAKRMIDDGADILDIGGESTRPGALAIDAEQELARVIPVIEGIRAFSDITLSIDTSKPEVMHEAIHAGATFINDVYALQKPGAMEMAAKLDVPVCLMHMKGTPNTMQDNPIYEQGVMALLDDFFTARIEACLAAGLKRHYLILDSGFGFGKTPLHNMILTQRLSQFKSFGLPLLFGASRKSTIGSILNRTARERLPGSIGLAVYAALNGANLIRTHDVAATRDAVMIVCEVVNARDEERADTHVL